MQLEDEIRLHDKRLITLERGLNDEKVRNATIENDIKHIKDKLDGHIMTTLSEIREKVTNIYPIVTENRRWIEIFQKSMVTVAVVGVIGGLVALFFYLIKTLYA